MIFVIILLKIFYWETDMKKLTLVGMLVLLSSFLFAQNIPTVTQIYQTVRHGNLPRASHMIQIVLQAHPNSAKAHYVDAEILAREGRLARARVELQIAKRISPTLSFVSAQSVNQLENILSQKRSYVASRSHIPYMTIILFIIAVLFVFLIIRSFRQKRNFGPGPYPNSTNANAGVNTQGRHGGFGGGFGGIGSGLASGLAAGVGFAAGEELFDHFTHEDNTNGSLDDNLSQNDSAMQPSDPDFGISDDSSWGDDSSGDFGGDDSW